MNRIGELFVLGFHGPIVPKWLKEFSQRFGLGGVILFDYYVQTKKYENNIYSPSQVQELCEEIHSLASRPLIFVDQEGGKVRRLKEKLGFTPFPSQQAFNSLAEEEKKKILTAVFSELKNLGFDVNMAPVVDLNYNPKNPDIGAVERSYSVSASEVLMNSQLVVEVAQKIGVELTLKHFPGLGGATVNSHWELTDLSDSIANEQLEVFQKLLGVIPSKAVVMSHGVVKQWDKDPVSISAVAVQKVRAWEKDAILITDDMQMMGLQKIYSTNEACKKALRAGLDVFCIGNNLLNEEDGCLHFAEQLQQAIKVEEILQKNYESSLERVKRLKERHFR